MASTEMPSQTRLTIEFIKIRLESLKHQYDYFKNMTTLNIGAFILVVAFMERAFKNPIWREVLLVSLVYFSVSLSFSESRSQGFRGFGSQWPQLLFNPASLFLAFSTSAIPGSASFQRSRNSETIAKDISQVVRI
ncbi:MAG: hypothetical protein GTN73_05385 [Candidatus Aminicenantes bacterium]|nr:hypothetical protein [Candidatus Aminicenantes bacterium]